ncbi:hypothetical protein QYF61_023064, partial [Mycteria americana]
MNMLLEENLVTRAETCYQPARKSIWQRQTLPFSTTTREAVQVAQTGLRKGLKAEMKQAYATIP